MKFDKIKILVIVLIILSPVPVLSQVMVVNKPDSPRVVYKQSAKPGLNCIWIEPHWRWSNTTNQYVWVKGYWVKNRNGFVYEKGYWEKTRKGYKWIPVHWKRSKKYTKRKLN